MTDELKAEKERLITQYRNMLEQQLNRLDVLDGQFDGQIDREKALATLKSQDPKSLLRLVLEQTGMPDVILRPGSPEIEAAAQALFKRLDRNGNDIIEEDEQTGLQDEIINGLITLALQIDEAKQA